MTEASALSEDDLWMLNALADGELDARSATALERRIAGEPNLRKVYEAIAATRSALGRVERPQVDARLQSRLETAVGRVAPAVATRRRPMWRRSEWRALAAAMLVAVFAAGGGGYWLGSLRPGQSTADMVASSHRRSLLAASPVDIASSNRHTVKPWLDGRIGISPPAPELAAKGFALVGGRVDVIRGRAVPTLVYRHNEHLITVVAEPAGQGTSKAEDLEADGYNMVDWMGSGFGYWAVSDLEPGELDDFVAAYRMAATPEPKDAAKAPDHPR